MARVSHEEIRKDNENSNAGMIAGVINLIMLHRYRQSLLLALAQMQQYLQINNLPII